jgi:hypothetical protein
MAVLTYKFDESYKEARTLMVAGWLTDDRQWKRTESRWQKAIAYENRTPPQGRKISRYHAAKMNANDGEYRGWENESYRKLRMTRKFLKIVSNVNMCAIACGIDLKAAREVFPDETLSDAYVLCMKEVMVEIACAVEDSGEDHRVVLIHDHGNWDRDALEGYNSLVDDPSWLRRYRFVSITPLTWRDDVGLQSADLIAYELLRSLDDRLWTQRDMRLALKALLGMNKQIYAKYIDKEALLELKRLTSPQTG